MWGLKFNSTNQRRTTWTTDGDGGNRND